MMGPSQPPKAKILKAVFAGETLDGDRVVLYQKGYDFHIKRPDGEIHALGPESTIDTWFDRISETTHIKIQSSAWTGDAIGSRRLLIDEPDLVLEYREEAS